MKVYRNGVSSCAHRHHQLRRALAKIFPAHPRNPAIAAWYFHLAAAARVPVPKVQRKALAVYPLAYDGVSDPALLQVRLRDEVLLHDRGLAVARESERGVVDVRDADALRGVDRGDVARGADVGGDARVGDDEQLVRACERRVERRGLSEVALAYLGARVLHLWRCAGGVVERDDDVAGWIGACSAAL